LLTIYRKEEKSTYKNEFPVKIAITQRSLDKLQRLIAELFR
jgi:hypothetical protein